MHLDYSIVFANGTFLLQGMLVTIEVVAVSLLLGVGFGLLAGLARLCPKHRVVYGIASVYVSFWRGTPLLVQLFILYFGLPQLGLKLPSFASAIVGLGMYSGSYISEIVRGAIQSIDRGQVEAARSLGMSQSLAMREVILPQAAVRMLPPLGNEFIALIKNSSLVSLLTISDLMRQGDRIIAVSYRSMEVYTSIAVLYFVLTFAMSQITRWLEHRLRLQ